MREILLERILETLLDSYREGSTSSNQTDLYNALVNPSNRTPNFIRTVTSGVVPGIPYSFSVFNSGAANGIILGQVIKPGEILNFSAGGSYHKFASGSITYDATGTEMLITYIS
jgi:hypothetical protein